MVLPDIRMPNMEVSNWREKSLRDGANKIILMSAYITPDTEQFEFILSETDTYGQTEGNSVKGLPSVGTLRQLCNFVTM